MQLLSGFSSYQRGKARQSAANCVKPRPVAPCRWEGRRCNANVIAQINLEVEKMNATFKLATIALSGFLFAGMAAADIVRCDSTNNPQLPCHTAGGPNQPSFPFPH